MTESLQPNNETTVKLEKPKLLGIITSPGETLDRIRQNPKVLVPLLVVMALTTIATFISFSTVDFVAVGIEQGMSQEEAEVMNVIMSTSFIVGGLLVAPFSLLISTLIYLAVTKIAGTGAKFKQLFSFSTYVFFISSIGALLNSVIAYSVGVSVEEANFTSLNGVVGAEGAVGALLSYLELFAIWGTVISAMGLERVGGLSKKAAWTVAIIFFVILGLIALIGGSFGSMMGA
ncbi:Yip1 family protein [Bacillus sp. FJAT-47783]|uniref:Yip1 family protein n=1 Tax=Bacillus sp. FJAT-47783 TaxID=2922712 RepID=UPI001FAB980A|nr:Yip1 family protein [Bacillus sp. FJAT-47783]